MFGKLQNKWKVSGGRLALIILTFALGGSLCGYAGRKILALTGMEKGALWVIIYIVLITILWPIAVILVSLLTGQFTFFRNYIRRIGRRMAGKNKSAPIHIAIFASGAGSNAAQIIQTLPSFFSRKNGPQIKIALVITNNKEAGVIQIAKSNQIPVAIVQLNGKSGDEASDAYFGLLNQYHIDFIILAGYLKMIPPALIKAYPFKIINIHPSLLPAHGGAGMYGNRVHQAVIDAKEENSGISIHHVDEIYDNGKIIFQADCKVYHDDTPATLAERIHELEHRHYSEVIANLIHSQNPR